MRLGQQDEAAQAAEMAAAALRRRQNKRTQSRPEMPSAQRG